VSQVDNLIALNDEHPLTTDSLSGSEVVFIDPGVRDLQTVLAGIKPGTDVVLLDPNRDALDQIAETLQGHHGISAVHIIADGKAGQIDFSSGALSLGNVTTGSHAADLSTIGSALSANGDLMIWSCNTAAGSTGQAFIDALAQQTGADVAASTGITGAASLGGNWILEAQTGPIEATVPLTAKGLQQVDAAGLDLSALSIIYPMTGTHGWTSQNNELGFSYGTSGDNVYKDINPGKTAVYYYSTKYYNYNASKPSDFTVLGNSVVFVATTASHGRELWITDGTSAGTSELKDINSGAGDAFPGVGSSEARVVVGSELFFTANDGTHGIELWKTDGTTSGSQLVDDIDSGSASGNITGMAALGSSLIFGANDGQTFGSSSSNRVGQLWTTDGTTTTKIFTATPGSGASYAPGIYGFVASGSHVFFEVQDGTFNPDNTQIYVTDGTAGGTHLLDPSVTDVGGGGRNLTDVNGTLYFTLDDGDSGAGHGFELWESDGTASGTFLVKDINPGNGASSPSGFVGTTNGEVFFAANDGTHGIELWETDGTAGNAQMVTDINTSSSGASSSPQDLVAIGNVVYFIATDGVNGQQLWESNGTTTQTVTTYATGGFSPSNLTNVNGVLYWEGQNLSGDPAGTNGLYKLVGTTVTEVAGNYSGLSSGDSHGGSSLGGFVFLGGGVVTQGEPDAFSTDEATSVTGQNLFSDNGSGPDTGTSLSIAQVQGSAGNVGSQITLASGAHLTVNADGTFTYDPNHAFNYLPSASSGASNLTATDTFTYQLTGTSSATTVTINLSGLDSNDTLTGTGGTDTLNPGTGNDTINALGGADTINMGANLNASDQIDGGTGNDTVTLNGNYSSGVTFSATTMVNVETISLASGHSYKLTTNDATVASGETLTVNGSGLGSGNTLTFSGAAETNGTFVLTGGAGDDMLTGGAGSDTLTGGAGSDTLNGGTGADTLIGGAGNDTYIVDNAGDLVTEAASAGTDTVKTTLASYTLGADVENLTYTGSAAFTGTGNTLANTITGGAGNDTLTGGAGNDTLSGGTGADHLTGGADNDTYIVDNAGDVVTEAASAGTDTVKTTLAAYTLGANVENLTYTGTSNFAGTGNTLANTITGGTGSDTLNGGTGADHLIGGAGNDTYIVDNAGDVVTEAASAGTDTVKTTLASYTLGANVENLIYTGTSNFAGTGNSLANMITGGAGNDTFNLGAYLTAADKIDGGAGTDTLNLSGNYSAGVTFNSTAVKNVEKIVLAAGYNYKLTTNNATVASGQTLTINGSALSASNVLTFSGAAETDGHFVIIGGKGADQLTGGALSDTFTYTSAAQSTSTHYDTITGFKFGTDSFDIPGGAGVITGINTKVASGSLSTATFDANLTSAISSSHLGAHHAVLFTPTSGTLSGATFLVVDLNGVAGYQAGSDLVVRMNGSSGTFTAGGFH